MKIKPKWVEKLPTDLALEDVKSWYLLQVLEHYKQNRTHAAKSLRISLRNLRNILDRLRVEGFPVKESCRQNHPPTKRPQQVYDVMQYMQKVLKQNDHLAKEIKKLIDEKEDMQKRLQFYQNTTDLI